MEELIKTAKIYYSSCSPAVRYAAQKFFKDIDHDNDGKVSLHEFLEFMRQEGHAKLSSRGFFKTLDRRGSGTLGFEEVLALFYIIQSGRPICRGCDVFVAGMYFTCSKCYQRDNNNVIFLCPKCFEKGMYTHSHGRNQFLDNYALLELKRKQGIAGARTRSMQQHQVPQTSSKVVASTSNAIVLYASPHHSSGVRRTSSKVAASKVVASTSNATNAIVPYAPRHHRGGHKWQFALQALQEAVKVATVVGYCVASSCSIM